jgi:hypothetical protein
LIVNFGRLVCGSSGDCSEVDLAGSPCRRHVRGTGGLTGYAHRPVARRW